MISELPPWPKAKPRCEAILHEGRPDRGPERRCFRPAKHYVISNDTVVCGYHAKAYTRITPIL